MNKQQLPSVTLIGAGNVGHHLALRLHQKGIDIQEIFSRDLAKAQSLARQVEAQACNNLKALSTQADVFIIAIKDNGLKKLTEEISFLNEYQKIVAHTSGATPMQVFAPFFDHYGVFYPLQTFSKHKAVDFEQLPFCIDGNNEKNRQILTKLAQAICPNVYRIDDQQRSVLHVTAVMVNNFANHLFAIAEQVCADKEVPFEILHPLIQETAKKIKHSTALDAQTGPAVRGDSQTISRHLQLLEAYPEYQAIYRMLTQSIQNIHKID